MGDGHGQAGSAIGGHGRARVETKPADPQQASARHGQAQIERRKRLASVTLARAQHMGAHQTGNAGIDMHHRAAGKIQRTQARQPAIGLPDPVRNRGVHHHRPHRHENQRGRKAHALDKRAHHQRRRDDGKGELKHRIHRLGNIRRNMADRDFLGVLDVIKPGKPEPFRAAHQMAPCSASGRECNRIPHRKPQQTDNGADGGHAGHDIEHAFAPHHAAVKQRNARQRHQQDQGGRGHHPGRVRTIDGFGADPPRMREHNRGCKRDPTDGGSVTRWCTRHGDIERRKSRARRRLGIRLRDKQAHPHPKAKTQRNQPLAVHTGLLLLIPHPIRNKKHKSCQVVHARQNRPRMHQNHASFRPGRRLKRMPSRGREARRSGISRGRDFPDALSRCAGYIHVLADGPSCPQRGEPRRQEKIKQRTVRHQDVQQKALATPALFFARQRQFLD